MKRNAISLALGSLAAAAVLAACTGPSGSGIPSATGAGPALRAVPNAPTTAVVVRHVFAGLTYDGTNFTVETHRSCGHRGLGGITPYVPTANGTVVLSSSLSMTPMCVSSHAKVTGSLYIFAIARHGGTGSTGGTDASRPHWNGVPIAGPANVTDNPWVFAPITTGVAVTAGDKYDFVVASSK
jgi:hypothetical protein